MKSFKDLELELEYRSDENNIYNEFYDCCLNLSVNYDRAVGYFTSGSLQLISKGLEKLIENKGKIRLVTSPSLNKDDLNALKAGEELKLIEDNLFSEWKNFTEEAEDDILKILAWLIAKDILEIKIAYQSDLKGLYHEKFGIFKDNYGNRIAFSGSVNETVGGMKNNFEAIEIYVSYEGKNELQRVVKKEKNFNNLWENKTNTLNIISLPEALKNNIISYKPEEYELKNIIEAIKEKKKKYDEINENPLEGMYLPFDMEIREYQQKALNSWMENKKGILEMATGTGKTMTALNIMYEVNKINSEKDTNVCFIILCPLTYLTEQWSEECSNFNLSSIVCNSANKNWLDKANSNINKLNYTTKNNSLALIVTNDTFKGTVKKQKFQHLLKKIKQEKKIMIVVDECHNIGTESFENILEDKIFKDIPLRLGLSATPKREGDEKGNQIIENYLGETIFYYSLKEAIENDFLTRYYYYPYYVSLTEDENEKYYELTSKIGKLEAIENKTKTIKDRLKLLYFERSRLLNLASEKTLLLLELFNKDSYNNLIYVGAGKRDDQEENNIIEIKEILEKKELKIEKFTAHENKVERKLIIDKFVKKEINGIVAIKCLDEGVNIPSIHRAYVLASTTNYREYVQRRGRILRKSKGKEYAEIYDFILVPREYLNSKYSLNEDDIASGKSLLKHELKRVEEYNSLSENKYRNEEKMYELKKKYDLLFEGGKND